MSGNALFFPDEDYFISYVRSLKSNLKGEFTLFQLNPFSDTDGGLVVTGIDATRITHLEVRPVTVNKISDESAGVKNRTKILNFSDEAGSYQAVINTEVKKYQILDLVRLLPTRETPAIPYVYFWIHKPELVSRIVTQSIRLDNDRILFAALKEKSGHSFLIRIEKASFFLIQRVLEEHGDKVEVYYPVLEDLFVAWGFRHPMEDLWRNSQKRREHWTFFNRNNERLNVAPVEWSDIYEFMDFDLGFSGDMVDVVENAGLKPFTIPLQLVAKSKEAEPSLWLVYENELDRLEALLAVIDQEDLAAYQVNISVDQNGQKFLLIRERAKNKNRLFIDFSSHEFATYRGYQNLYLPVGLELQPNIRRDTYRNLFELKPGENTIVIGGEKPRVIKIADSGFKPLSNYIDYVLEQSLEELKPVIEGSYFDLSVYKNLAKVGFAQENVEKKTTPTEIREEKPDQEKQNEQKAKEEKNKGFWERLFGSNDDEAEDDDTDISPELKQQDEIAAERKVIGQPALEHWADVLDIKEKNKRITELESCLVNLIWLLPPTESESYLIRWGRLLMSPGAETLGTNTDVFQTKRQVLNMVMQAEKAENNLAKHLSDAINGLKQVENEMLIKERWLLWHVILRRNKDVREQARLREQIRRTISDGLVDLQEIPEFIRARIFADRRLNTADNNSVDLVAVQTNLDHVKQFLENIEYDFVQKTMVAIVARNYCREMEMQSSAIKLLQEFNTRDRELPADNKQILKFISNFLSTGVTETRAWSGLYLMHAFPGIKGLAEQFQKLSSQCDENLRQELYVMHKFLMQREEDSNPHAFLSEENRSRFYPKGGQHATGELAEAVDHLQAAATTADKEIIKKTLLEVLANLQNINNDIQLSRLIGELVRCITMIKWDSDSHEVDQAFVEFALKVSSQSDRTNPFYAVLRYSNLAQGLVELGHMERAKKTMQKAFEFLDKISIELDFVDASSNIISAIESFDLKERKSLIQSLSKIFTRQFASDQRYGSSHMRCDLIRIFDQLVAACSSKDKLSMNLFKNYQQQDEFIILNRILNEKLD